LGTNRLGWKPFFLLVPPAKIAVALGAGASDSRLLPRGRQRVAGVSIGLEPVLVGHHTICLDIFVSRRSCENVFKAEVLVAASSFCLCHACKENAFVVIVFYSVHPCFCHA
jgi:hypothetical protein